MMIDDIEPNCDICPEVLAGVVPSWLDGRSRVLYETDNFVVAPTLGCIVPGYVLIWARMHTQSMASFSHATSDELWSVVEHVESSLSGTLGSMAVFEHGSDGASMAGSCLDHAHLHVFPCDNALDQQIRSSRSDWKEFDVSRIGELAGRPYLLYRPPNEDGMLAAPTPGRVQSQFVRRLIARNAGLDHQWDWGAFPHISNLRATQEVWTQRN